MICKIFNSQFDLFYNEQVRRLFYKNRLNTQKLHELVGIMESNIELMPKLVYAF